MKFAREDVCESWAKHEYERELVGIVENRDTRRCDQSVELKRGDAQTKPERA